MPRQYPNRRRLVGLLVAAAVLAPAARSGDTPRPTRRYTLTWTLDPSKGVRALDGSLFLVVPGDRPYQGVSWRITGVRTQRVVQRGDCSVVAVLPGNQPFELQVTVTEKPYRYDVTKGERAGGVTPAVRSYLAEDPAVQSHSARLVKLAKELKGSDTAATVENIRRWLLDHVRYHYDPKTYKFRTLDELLRRGHAECGGFTALAVALCRDAGVPAREVWGVARVQVDFQDLIPAGSFGSHAWAEVYFPGAGWVPVDVLDRQTPLGEVPPDRLCICSLVSGTAETANRYKAGISNFMAMTGGAAVPRYDVGPRERTR